MLWPPTPRVSPQLHQASSRPGFHGAWWYRSRTTRVLRDPPPARGKRQGGDDGRTKTTPRHRGRNERGRGPSLRARALRGLHARRVSHGHTREPFLARRLERGAGARRSCLASPRGSRREEKRARRPRARGHVGKFGEDFDGCTNRDRKAGVMTCFMNASGNRKNKHYWCVSDGGPDGHWVSTPVQDDATKQDSVKILGFWHFFVNRNPRNLRPESSSLVSTPLTHSGDDEDPEDSGIILLFFVLGSPGSAHRTQLQNVCVLHWSTQGNHSDHSASHPNAPMPGFALSSTKKQYVTHAKPPGGSARRTATVPCSTD